MEKTAGLLANNEHFNEGIVDHMKNHITSEPIPIGHALTLTIKTKERK